LEFTAKRSKYSETIGRDATKATTVRGKLGNYEDISYIVEAHKDQ